jgi:cytochrome c oxidase cbb3-type subunit 3
MDRSPSPLSSPKCVALALTFALTIAIGCSRRADALPEWRPSDHDHAVEPTGGLDTGRASPNAGADDRGTTSPGGAADVLASHGIDEVILTTWTGQCATCHGTIGRGDGPQAALVGAPDLSRPDWHASIKDEDIARSIRGGKNRMPAFDLPQSTLEGLVRLIRLMDRARAESASAAPSASGAPTAPASTPDSINTAQPGTSAAPKAGGSPVTRTAASRTGENAPAAPPPTSVPAGATSASP